VPPAAHAGQPTAPDKTEGDWFVGFSEMSFSLALDRTASSVRLRRITGTELYTHVSLEDLKAVMRRAYPHGRRK
jgi:hypothetical protein